MSEESREQLRALAGALVTKADANPFSPFLTGVVIAGFGRDEYFPTLYEFELETIALGRLKYRQEDAIQIGSEDGPAVIRSFAQGEQVDTFMRGMDRGLTDATVQYWSAEARNLVEKVAHHLDMSKEETDDLLEAMDAVRDEMTEKFSDELETLQSEMNVWPIISVVEMMPKDELAAMAEALVNLTSFKREGDLAEGNRWRSNRRRGHFQGRRACLDQAQALFRTGVEPAVLRQLLSREMSVTKNDSKSQPSSRTREQGLREGREGLPLGRRDSPHVLSQGWQRDRKGSFPRLAPNLGCARTGAVGGREDLGAAPQRSSCLRTVPSSSGLAR